MNKCINPHARRFKQLYEIIFKNKIDEIKSDKVFPFFVCAQGIYDNNIITVRFIEPPHYRTTDKTCSARYNYHSNCLLFLIEANLIIFVSLYKGRGTPAGTIRV